MKHRIPLLALLSLPILLFSCGGDDGGSDNVVVTTPEEEEEDTPPSGPSRNEVDLTIDSELTGEERRALSASTSKVSSVTIDGDEIQGFRDIFKGSRSSNVVSYLETRVNYALSSATDLSQRLIVEAATLANFNQETIASNPSVLIWYSSLLGRPADLEFQINDDLVEVESSRIGVMQLGEGFLQFDTMTQAITLVHEARHSDCTGGARESDLERITQGLAPSNLKCGHLHAVCPPGHPFAGVAACDANPWGAYLIDAVYSAAITETCSNCSQADLQSAEINFFDVEQRLLYDVEALFDGELGPADMSSSSQIRD